MEHVVRIVKGGFLGYLIDAVLTQPQHTLEVLRAMYLGAGLDAGLEVTLALANKASLEVRDGLNVRCIVPLA
jgi:hypothetical protein